MKKIVFFLLIFYTSISFAWTQDQLNVFTEINDGNNVLYSGFWTVLPKLGLAFVTLKAFKIFMNYIRS